MFYRVTHYMCICEKSMKHISEKAGRMICKVTHCTGRILANTTCRPHELCWSDRETATSFILHSTSGVLHYVTSLGSEGLCNVIVRYSLYLNTHIHVLTTCVSVELTSCDIM